MPSAVNFKGIFSRRPGVYAAVDTSALEIGTTTTNRIAIVADLPFLQQGVSKTVTSQNALTKLEASSSFLQNIAKILFNPANDSNVTGSPAAVTLVSPNPSTQALKHLNCNSSEQLTVKAKSYGSFGNQLQVSVANNANDSALKDVLVKRGSTVETFTAIGTGNVFTTQYTAAASGVYAHAVTAAYARATGLTIKQTLKSAQSGLSCAADATVTYATAASDKIIFKGPIKVSLFRNDSATSAGSGSNAGAKVTITGTNLAGSATTEIAEFQGGANNVTTTAKFATVTSVVLLTQSSAVSGTYTVDLDVDYVVNAADHATIQLAVDEINGKSAQGFVASVVEPFYSSSVAFNKMDAIAAGTDMKGSAMGVKADLQEYVRVLAAYSALATAEEKSGAVGNTLDATSGYVSLTGGSETAESSLSDSHWATAIDALRVAIDPVSQETIDVQTIVLFNTSESVQKDLRDHCDYMAGAGKNECNGWVAMPSDSSVANIRARSKALNTRHLSVVFQDMTTTASDGAAVKLDPRYTALALAGIQNSTATGVPMTNKLINAQKIHQLTSISLIDSVEDLLESSVVVLMPTALGYKVERSLTTMQSDNMAFNEVSGNESINTSIRDLRAALDSKIGQPNVATTLQSVTSIVKSRLRDQVSNGIIKAVNESSVEAIDQGDAILIRYTAAPTLPINFIKIEASFVAAI